MLSTYNDLDEQVSVITIFERARCGRQQINTATSAGKLMLHILA